MIPYTATDIEGYDIKAHINDVYTIIEVEGQPCKLAPENAGKLLLWLCENAPLSTAIRRQAKEVLEGKL